MDELLRYLNSLKPDQQRAFAAACETSVGYLRKAISIGTRLGEKLAIAIERESGGAVTCEVLRPDVDWAYLRGTRASGSGALSSAPPVAAAIDRPALVRRDQAKPLAR